MEISFKLYRKVTNLNHSQSDSTVRSETGNETEPVDSNRIKNWEASKKIKKKIMRLTKTAKNQFPFYMEANSYIRSGGSSELLL